MTTHSPTTSVIPTVPKNTKTPIDTTLSELVYMLMSALSCYIKDTPPHEKGKLWAIDFDDV